MDYDLTKEQQYIQKAAREFAMGEFPDVAREFDINETFPAEILKKARELDLVGLFIPEAYGESGSGYRTGALLGIIRRRRTASLWH
jgi:alkylation response protein AidB-like acyl-CoA dehydrogenase